VALTSTPIAFGPQHLDGLRRVGPRRCVDRRRDQRRLIFQLGEQADVVAGRASRDRGLTPFKASQPCLNLPAFLSNGGQPASGESDDCCAQESRGMPSGTPARRTSIPTTALVLLTADHKRNRQAGAGIRAPPQDGRSRRKGQAGPPHLPCPGRACHDQERSLLSRRRSGASRRRQELLGKARVEHDGLRRLIAKIRGHALRHPTSTRRSWCWPSSCPAPEERRGRDLSPTGRHSGLDLVGTGERMAARKAQLATAPIRPQADPSGPEGMVAVHRAKRFSSGNRCGPVSVDLPRRQGDAAEAVIPDNT